MKLVFGSLVRVVILQDNRGQINIAGLPAEQPFDFLEHDQYLTRSHTVVPIIITDIIHLTELILHRDVRDEAHAEDEVDERHGRDVLVNEATVLCELQWLESVKHESKEVIKDRGGLEESVHCESKVFEADQRR